MKDDDDVKIGISAASTPPPTEVDLAAHCLVEAAVLFVIGQLKLGLSIATATHQMQVRGEPEGVVATRDAHEPLEKLLRAAEDYVGAKNALRVARHGQC